MKNRKKMWGSVAAAFVLCGALASWIAIQSGGQITGNEDDAYVRAQYTKRLGENALIDRAEVFGVETSSLGLHVLFPRDYGGGLRVAHDRKVGSFVFHTLDTQAVCGDLYPNLSGQEAAFPLISDDFSVQRLIDSVHLKTISKVASPTTSGTYALRWDISTEAMKSLATVHGKVAPTEPYSGWTGGVVLAGQTPMTMHASLVCDSNAFGAVNVTELVASGNATATVIIADRLTSAQADDLVAKADLIR